MRRERINSARVGIKFVNVAQTCDFPERESAWLVLL